MISSTFEKSTSVNVEQLKSLLKEQKDYLDNYFDQLDLEEASNLVELISNLEGIVFLTGVGKSGFIAQKIAATLVSIGLKAMFLPPVDALHGDLGIVGKNDLFISLSKSGESHELLNLIPYIRNRGVKVVSIVSDKKSRLAMASDLAVFLPLSQELCPHNMVPTTSCEVQLLFGDLLAVSIMKQRAVSLNHFAQNHPAGKIGKRLSLKVKDLMLTGDMLPLCYESEKLEDVLESFTKKRCGCLIILDQRDQLKGIFTDGDLRRALQKHGPKFMQMSLSELKISSPRVITEDKMAIEALKLMEENQKSPIMVLPVVNQQRNVKGLIKMHDILQSGIS